MLAMHKIMCEVINSEQAGRKLDSQIMQLTGNLKCKTHTLEDNNIDKRDTSQSNANILDYLQSSANIEADKGVSRVII